MQPGLMGSTHLTECWETNLASRGPLMLATGGTTLYPCEPAFTLSQNKSSHPHSLQNRKHIRKQPLMQITITDNSDCKTSLKRDTKQSIQFFKEHKNVSQTVQTLNCTEVYPV